MSGKLTRQRWEEVRDNYQGSVDDADALAQEAVNELDGPDQDDVAGPVAAAWALLSIARRIEALSDMFLDFMEPAGPGRARGAGGQDD